MWRSYPRSLLKNFYPRSPCGERRCWDCAHKAPAVFLSTLSLRRATCFSKTWGDNLRYFYPRSPCGERRFCIDGVFTATEISIHALLAESDLPALASILQLSLFLSTLSLRRATVQIGRCCIYEHISIHALLAESDSPKCVLPWTTSRFLSTLSLRRATIRFAGAASAPDISIHALLAESDAIYLAMSGTTFQFLSTLSLRRATVPGVRGAQQRKISIHAVLSAVRRDQVISIHALLAESDLATPRQRLKPWTFLSTLSLRRATWQF